MTTSSDDRASIAFGRSARELFSLAESGTFLNHGSFGACPRAVQEAQQHLRRELEAQPDRFFTERIVPRDWETPLRAVARELGAFVGAPGEHIALVENATAGIQSVLGSVALGPGDEILLTNHQYNAVRAAAEARGNESGATVRIATIPVPTDAAEIRARIREAAAPNVKLAIVDHITSASALLFPIREIIADLHERGIRVLVDGAHAIGHIPLDLADLGADWYVSNAHKWLFAARGSAWLYAAPSVAAQTRPIVTSHFSSLGFPRSFDYIGTRDYTAWLAIPAAIAFYRSLDPDALEAHNAGLIALATNALTALGAAPLGPIEATRWMRSFVLPQRRAAEETDARALTADLWEHASLQIMATVAFDALVVRVSAQAYVDEADIRQLHAVLDQRGWPGR